MRLTVVSKEGKEATIGIVNEGNFFGEGSLAGQLLRMGSAAAMEDCELLRVDKKAMMDALHRDLKQDFINARSYRSREDQVGRDFDRALLLYGEHRVTD